MKIFIGIILSLFVIQTLAGPIEKADEDVTPEPEPEQPNFSEELRNHFYWYLAMHDRTNAQMRQLRQQHVQLVEEYYEQLLEFFAEDLVALNMAADQYLERMQTAVVANEGMTPCLTEIQGRFERKLANTNGAVRECAKYANMTMSQLFLTSFYPTMRAIQQGQSFTPLSLLLALSRANILTEQSRILSYAQNYYDILELGWTGSAEQSFAWETQHFRVEAEFLLEEMAECSATDVTIFVNDAMRMIREIDACGAEQTH